MLYKYQRIIERTFKIIRSRQVFWDEIFTFLLCPPRFQLAGRPVTLRQCLAADRTTGDRVTLVFPIGFHDIPRGLYKDCFLEASKCSSKRTPLLKPLLVWWMKNDRGSKTGCGGSSWGFSSVTWSLVPVKIGCGDYFATRISQWKHADQIRSTCTTGKRSAARALRGSRSCEVSLGIWTLWIWVFVEASFAAHEAAQNNQVSWFCWPKLHEVLRGWDFTRPSSGSFFAVCRYQLCTFSISEHLLSCSDLGGGRSCFGGCLFASGPYTEQLEAERMAIEVYGSLKDSKTKNKVTN